MRPDHVLGACTDVTWHASEAIPWWDMSERSDAGESYISAQEIRPVGEFSRVVLTTKYVNGSGKLVGNWQI